MDIHNGGVALCAGVAVCEFVRFLADGYGCAEVRDLGCVASRQLDDSGFVVLWTDARSELRVRPGLLDRLRDLLAVGPFAVVTASAEDAAGLHLLLEAAGLEVMCDGITFDDDIRSPKATTVSVVRRPSKLTVRPGFRVVGIAGAYNEEDVIESFLRHTIAQGVEVFLLDNWSTDRTAERAARFLGQGLIGIEKFPADGPSGKHEWYRMLRRKEALSREIAADWYIHLDPDEIRESPWPGTSIREALYRAELDGFSAVDHTCVVFHPAAGEPVYREELPLANQFSFFEFGVRPGHFSQIKAWAQQPGAVDLAESGGHDVVFEGRRVYPFKFLLRHYPIRSNEHGQRKVFRDRLPRFNRDRGWHTQYDKCSAGNSFVRDPAGLNRFEERSFYRQYLLERLTGIGIRRPQ